MYSNEIIRANHISNRIWGYFKLIGITVNLHLYFLMLLEIAVMRVLMSYASIKHVLSLCVSDYLNLLATSLHNLRLPNYMALIISFLSPTIWHDELMLFLSWVLFTKSYVFYYSIADCKVRCATTLLHLSLFNYITSVFSFSCRLFGTTVCFSATFKFN